ncbi:thiamine pyrophosphate-binding protein [Saccharopolyspora phatthalungensis]|uniref:Benzoylformate decarboxylase/acetolactate synthase-1/2/3 large subunit n=1 Tax=Saccharopolyspora phatthalungensis TaxID=664693 RepID=A0A840QKU2_9PSEU|nr:thiamine pyrophosphate-binding protein [Saccharopolyspora phatthalungensis]MBB5159433.1 benzoylformate decarboxylase/acetolactate synthase-1/2/3 large subunit [Saccharopolyspora phatthalungensis]
MSTSHGQTVNGAELLTRSLVRLGVEHVFNIPGLGLFPLVEAFYRHRDEMRYITALNETNLALIANGYARATGKPAFVNVYHASGTALAMMAVTTAWGENVPLVLTTTTSSRALIGRDQYAGVPRAVTEMSEQFVKWSAEVPSVDRIPEFLERAFQIAGTAPYGPVHLAFPMDLWAEETTLPAEQAEAARPMVFAAAADAEGIERVESLLAASERPILVAGGEVVRYGAIDQLVALAEALGCPVLSEPYIADLGFPTTHPQYVGKLSANRDLVDKADVALLVGVELTESGLGPAFGFADGTVVVNTTTDANALRRQFRPDIGLVGHPHPTLARLAAALSADQATAQKRDARLEATSAARRSHNETTETLRRARWDEQNPLSIGRILDVLQRSMPADTVVVNHAGAAQLHLELMLDVDDPSRYFGISGKASAQGWGGPAAIGIQLARPQQRVVAVLGDGGFQFSSTCLYTASRFSIPVIYLILNNGGWRDIASIARHSGNEAAAGEAEFGWSFTDPPIDHAAFARSLGMHGVQVGDAAGLDKALAAAFASDAPTLIEIDNSTADVEDFFTLFTK